MSDSFQQVTSVSWIGRLGRSVIGVLIGLLIVVLMVIGLFWNEGRAVQTARSLAEGRGAVVSVAAGSVDPANEGRLIHVSGPIATAETLSDPDFGISTQGVRLSRKAEMYQWKEGSKSETEKKLGGGEETVTTYTYSKVWDDSAIDSADFKRPDGHQNPPMDVQSRTYQIQQATLGAFTLGKPVLDLVGGDETYAISTQQAAAVGAAYQGGKRVSVADGRIYLGADPSSPVPGDTRIGYELAPLGTISAIGKQAGARLEPYQTSAGDALLMVDRGDMPADTMFSEAVTANTVITWLLRGVGLLLLGIGFALIMAPLGVVFDVIPFLGGLARAGTGLIALFLAILVGAATIGIAWFWYRPLLAIGIIAAGVVVAFLAARLGRRKAAQPATAAPA